MRELHYGSGVITVSFDVCSAVFDYTVALANAGRTDRITIPVLNGGERGFSNLLLGPQTQLYCTASGDEAGTGETTAGAGTSTPGVDLDDAELIETLKRKTAQLSNSTSLSASSGSLNGSVDESELGDEHFDH
ncbi:hypothetical protein [Subtercola lobariae]|uniref:Uncharacterized protein n=1 Tax=Subtercola lobariae TaxID=1588641 RepID=A0A917B241_9MICO|nr:hypothetical protein [Subtercola lobariae]GGF16100.1 hypothetical protein GCM10011399_07410 [Subtercola lobariae]